MVVYGEGFAPVRRSTAWCGRRRATRRRLPPGSSSRLARSAASRLGHALVDEATPFDPRNAYASSKVAQEFYAANWARLTGGAADRAALSQCLRAGHAARHALCRALPRFLCRPCGAAKRRRYSRTAISGAISSMSATWPRATVLACEKHGPGHDGLQCRIRHAAHRRRHGGGACRCAERAAAGRHRALPARRRPPYHGRFIPPARANLIGGRKSNFGTAWPKWRRNCEPSLRPI